MAKRKKKKSRAYGIGITMYICALAVAIIIGISKIWDYAEAYELSRPTNVMDEYVANISKNLWDESMEKTISQMPHEVQSDEECAEIVKSMLHDEISYARKSGGGDASSVVVYNLRCGDSVFGQVTLIEDESRADEVKYGMLPWKIAKEEFDFDGLYTSVEVTVPRMYTVKLNDVKLDKEYIVEENIHYDILEEYYEDYPKLPTKVKYKFDNIIGHLEPVIYDEDGNEVVIDDTKDDSQYIHPCSDSQLKRLEEFAKNFAERYIEYIGGKYEATYGYQRLMPYLKLDADLDKRMKEAQDGLSWSHTWSLTVSSAVLNGATDLGDGFYVIDITAEATSLSTGHGEQTNTNNMKVIVSDTGSDIRAITLELY